LEQVAFGESAATNSASEPNREVNTAADLARLRTKGKLLTTQELKELNTRVKALEEMARLEDRLKILESRKRTSQAIEDLISQSGPSVPQPIPQHLLPLPGSSSIISSQASVIRPSIEQDNPSDSSNTTTYRPYKRARYTRSIKVTPSYTLKVSSSLREWGDWKRDIERVFEGDPDTYRTGGQKILKALDYLEPSLKSLWYTYSEQKGGTRKWPIFLNWTRENVQNGQNAIATLYEQLNWARQTPNKSPIEFNAYLSAIERDLLQ
jgi:hypothetical protein